MAPVPEEAFLSLLGEQSRTDAVAFVADLWRARDQEVRRDGDRLYVDGRELHVVTDVEHASQAADTVVVSGTPLPPGTPPDVVGPVDLHEMLLYDVPRGRATEVFETHFGRSLEANWADSGDRRVSPTPGQTGEGRSGGTGDRSRTVGAVPPPVLPARMRRLLVRTGVSIPRNPRQVRAVARDRRVHVAVGIGLVVLPAVWWGLFVVHPAPTEPIPVPFSPSDSERPVDGGYTVEGRLATTVDGETFSVAGSRTYAPGDPSVTVTEWTYAGPEGWTRIVGYVENGSYVRQTWSNASDYRSFRESRRDDEDFVTAVDATRTVYVASPNRTGNAAGLAGSFPLSVLARVPYERRGTTTHDGRTVVRYVPRRGWVTRSFGLLDDRRTTWSRSARGAVLVDPDTGVVLHATLRATVVEARTWWGALTRPGVDLSVHYDVDPGVDDPTPPPWVETIDRNATAANLSG